MYSYDIIIAITEVDTAPLVSACNWKFFLANTLGGAAVASF